MVSRPSAVARMVSPTRCSNSSVSSSRNGRRARSDAIAQQEEKQEEHDDELCDEAHRVADEAGEVAANIGCGGAGSVGDVDGTGEGLDLRRERGTVGDEAADPVLMGSATDGFDECECLFAKILSEKVR